MLRFFALVYVIPIIAHASDLKASCTLAAINYGLSPGFNHTIAHAIHSITVEGLKIFHPQATANNGIPTVNRDTNIGGIVENAPDVVLPTDTGGFVTPAMKIINALWSNLGEGTDGYSDAWSPIERVVHDFHMRDLWHAVHDVYTLRILSHPPSDTVCSCLLDTEHNGIRSAVQWVADQYKQWTPITLLGRPIPKLTNKASWSVWRDRITHYYDKQSLFDAATYLYCVVGRVPLVNNATNQTEKGLGGEHKMRGLTAPQARDTTMSKANVGRCAVRCLKAGMSAGFNHTVAHAIHSLTVEGLRLFCPHASAKNGVPTVNRNTNVGGIVEDAPAVVLPPDNGGFVTQPMKIINALWSNLGEGTDGYSDAWSPIERVVHDFHMRDLWQAVHGVYTSRVLSNPPSEGVCSCLLDTDNNGIRSAVQWVADQYKRWTPITLLGRPIPKLTDKTSWMVWRDRITYYYDEQSLFDAAMYMYCWSEGNVRNAEASMGRFL